MPLHWTIDSRAKLMVVVGEGPVQIAHVESLLDVIAGSHVVSYRKLFDGRLAENEMDPTHQLAIGARLRAMHTTVGHALGPLAFVMRDENYWRTARVLGILAVPKRPMRMFQQIEKARAWLDSPAIMATVPA